MPDQHQGNLPCPSDWKRHMRNSLNRAAAQGAFGIPRARRLHDVVAAARRWGVAHDRDVADALEAIEDAIWGDGLLPIDRPSQRRAWGITRALATHAFFDGARAALPQIAREAVTLAEGNHYRSLYVTAWRAGLSVESEDEIVGAVRNALAEGGNAELSGASPLFPVRRAMRARANGCDDELRSFDLSHEGPAFVVFGEFEGLTETAQVTAENESAPDEGEPSAFDLSSEPGLLGDIARWSQVCAFRPVVEFAQPAALAVLAAMFGRRWATPTGLGLNLYLVAIAETGGGKDALLDAPRRLLAAAGFRHLLGPGDFSSDAAIEKSLRSRPSQIMPLDEFGKLAQAMMGRNAPAFAKLAAKSILELYPRSGPGSEWTGKARASDEHDCAAEPIHSPTLSLLGVSTPEGFFDGMSQSTLDDGFLNRLTVVRAGATGDRQRDPARLTPPTALLDALREAHEASQPTGNLAEAAARNADAVPPMNFARWADDAAIAEIERVEAWEDAATDAGRRGVAGRTAEQVQKIATLRALSRSPSDPAVEAGDLRWAFSMVEASILEIERGARENMSGSDFEALVNSVERATIQAGEAGIARSHLVRSKGVSKFEDRMVEAAIKRLEVAQRIWCIGPAGKRLRIRRPDERIDS
jgi:hypothetical protein